MTVDELITKSELEKVKNEIIAAVSTQLATKSNGKRWLKSSDVMEMLGLSASGLQNLRVSNVLPYSKIGGTIYYDYNEIDKILEKNRTNANVKSLPAQ